MKYVYIDESIHDDGEFILSGIVFCSEFPDDIIGESLVRNGFNPLVDEFKSGISYRKFPKMVQVRDDMKSLFCRTCKLGIVVIPRSKRNKLGQEVLYGLAQFIDSNNFSEPLEIFIDEGIIENESKGLELANQFGLGNYHFDFQADSITRRGIQLSDMVSHCYSMILKQKMGLVSKMVKAGDNSGFDPEMELELSYELNSHFRYNLLRSPDPIGKDSYEPMFAVDPYGLYVSGECDDELVNHVLAQFEEIWLGCIH